MENVEAAGKQKVLTAEVVPVCSESADSLYYLRL